MDLLHVFDDSAAHLRSKIAWLCLILVGANVGVWGWALSAFHDRSVLLGTAFLAYSFGLRHTFDADHIDAIDDVTREMMQSGKQPITVGFFFSLGHSSVVVAPSVAIALTTAALQDRFENFREVGRRDRNVGVGRLLVRCCHRQHSYLPSVYCTCRSVKRGGRLLDGDLDQLLAGGGVIGRLFPPRVRHRGAKLAHACAGPPVRARLRHWDGGGPTRHLGEPGLAGLVDLVGPGDGTLLDGRRVFARTSLF